MPYLLDTDICISFLQGKFSLKEKIADIGSEKCFISEITVGELLFGAEKSANKQKHLVEIGKIVQLFAVMPIYGSLPIFAQEKTRLQKLGQLIPDFDLLIGATAINNQLVMVTNNEVHLSRIKNIQIENWQKPDFNQFIGYL